MDSIYRFINNYVPYKGWLVPNKRGLSFRRLCSLLVFKFKRLVHIDYSFQPPKKSSLKIDVFIPVIEKDAAMLGMTINSIRQYVWHPIGGIYIVAPAKSARIAKIAKEKNCIFVEEEQVLPFEKQSINYKVGKLDRSGWVYKMLLNLYADTICDNRYILILDADTQFIAPQIFLYKNKPLFNLSDEYHEPYFAANYKLLGIKHRLSRSFITHYMLFDATVLKSLRAAIEQRWQLPWYQAIIESIDTTELSGFADYEIYGDYYVYRSHKPYILNYWSNKSLYLDSFESGADYIKIVKRAIAEHTTTHRSVSLHNYEG